MNFTVLGQIPASDAVIRRYPLNAELASLKARRDQAIRAVLEGQSDQFILVVGPCSADNEEAVCEFTARLGRLQEKVADRLILIPRIYTNKPRTTGAGYKGIFHQPDPEKEPDMTAGLLALRRMHIRSMQESGLTAADEMLYPENHGYLDDILSYVAVGARSVENQQHRLTASAVTQPVGMKNPTSGDMLVMLNSVFAAQQGHIFAYQGQSVRSKGNSLTHCVLRGAVNQYGRSLPNYHFEDLEMLARLYSERELHNPACLIDTNHANSSKKYDQQPRIALEVLHSRRLSAGIRQLVKGLMIESYLVSGSQPVGGQTYGQSITDACLGWQDTHDLIWQIADLV